MKSELRAYLDGELPYDGLPRDLRVEATAWDALLDDLGEPEPSGAPGWIEDSVMAEIARKSPAGRGVLDWLLTPRPVRISPLTGALAAAGLTAAIFLARVPPQASRPPGTSGPAGVQVYVEFNLEAPGAGSVAVAGDFTGWDASHQLEDPDGDGVWSARVPLRPGIHQYMFVVDGERWITDPRAERYADDGFGNRNAVLAVTTPTEL